MKGSVYLKLHGICSCTPVCRAARRRAFCAPLQRLVLLQKLAVALNQLRILFHQLQPAIRTYCSSLAACNAPQARRHPLVQPLA